MNYTVDEFVEIIRDIDGISYIREDVRKGYPVVIMEAGGKILIIDKENEYLDDEIGKNYLRALDISFMIGALFPDCSSEINN